MAALLPEDAVGQTGQTTGDEACALTDWASSKEESGASYSLNELRSTMNIASVESETLAPRHAVVAR